MDVNLHFSCAVCDLKKNAFTFFLNHKLHTNNTHILMVELFLYSHKFIFGCLQQYHMKILVDYLKTIISKPLKCLVRLAGAVEYIDCISAEG